MTKTLTAHPVFDISASAAGVCLQRLEAICPLDAFDTIIDPAAGGHAVDQPAQSRAPDLAQADPAQSDQRGFFPAGPFCIASRPELPFYRPSWRCRLFGVPVQPLRHRGVRRQPSQSARG
ncbi:hypothetical protein [Marinovum sp.]|uniref:hypothetical protein n=1 Tax=Marinovum sp. TaxID=2024839 RepID=UPI003A955BAA